MKRNLLCLLFAVVMLLSLTACGGDKSQDEPSDFESFMEVQKKMQDVRDLEFKMDMKASVSGEEAIDMSMSGTGKEVVVSKDDIQMEMKYKMNIPGLDADANSNVEGTMYMKDQAVYMDVMGQKLKMDASNEMAAMMNVDADQMLDITEDMVSDLKVSRDGSDTVYSFSLDASKAMDYFEENVESSQQLDSMDDVTFDKMDVTVVADEEDMVKSIDMDCSVTTAIEDETSKMNYQVTMEYISINTDLKIDFPDFSQYQELSV